MSLNRLDEEFAAMLIRIENLTPKFDKHCRIRIMQWIKKLSGILCNEIWKKNRNSYTRLLLSSMEADRLIDPFKKMPTQGSLPNMKEHEIKQLQTLISLEDKEANHHIKAHQPKDNKDPRAKSSQKQYSGGRGFVTSSHKKVSHIIHPVQHIKTFDQESSLNHGHYTTNLKINWYKTRINDLERLVTDSAQVFRQTAELLKKHKNQLDHNREYMQVKSEVQKMLVRTINHNQNLVNSRSHVDGEDLEVKVFSTEDEIQNLRFGLD